MQKSIILKALKMEEADYGPLRNTLLSLAACSCYKSDNRNQPQEFCYLRVLEIKQKTPTEWSRQFKVC